MAISLTELNADVISTILEYLDINSCVNLSKTSKVFKDHFREHVTRKLFLKKLQFYLINILFKCYERGTFGDFQVFHHLCKSVMSHISHMAHNFYILSNANHVKEKMIVELILKSLSLPTTGLDILPPVDSDHNSNTWINHWYCYEVHDNRYIFLMSCKDINGWYRQQKHSDQEFVSAVIHYPFSVEERTMYFACRLDPICDWNSLIEETCVLSSSTDPNTYLEYIADELKEIVSDNEEKGKVTAEFLFNFVAYTSHPVELNENIDNGYEEKDLENMIQYSKETMAKCFHKFLYEISYSKCFPKVDAQYTFMIKSFFDFFLDLYELVPYKELNDLLDSLLNIFKPMQLSFFTYRMRQKLLERNWLPVFIDLFKRIQIEECLFSNEQEKFVLYLKDDLRVEWSYTNSFPFPNKFLVNDELVLSYFFDRIHGKQPEGFPEEYNIAENDDEDLEEKFEKLFRDNRKLDFLRLRDIFTNYVEENFRPAPEIDLEFLSSLLLSLSNTPQEVFSQYEFKLEDLL